MVRLLLSKGADANLAAGDGATPLLEAVDKGHHAIACVLVSKGADIHLPTAKGFTPLHVAALRGHLESAELLLSRGADANAASVDRVTPLEAAAQNGSPAMVALLLSKGANKMFDGSTPVRFAARDGHRGNAESPFSRAASSPGSLGRINRGPLPAGAVPPPAGDSSGNRAADNERETAGGTEELHRVDELSRLVHGLSADGDAPGRTCDMCGGEAEKMKRCPCHSAYYCSAECQK